MALSRYTQTLLALTDRYRPALFSVFEWRFYLLSMPIMMPVGAYFIMGERYFQNPVTFAVGTVVNLAVYWYTLILFTLAVRWVIRQFPNLQQAGVRTVAMLLLVGLIMAATAVLDLWLFSMVPGTGVQFSWEAVVPLWLFGCVASPIFCLTLGMFYIYAQWQERQTENEQLKREAVQQQYDALRGQVNPHFLFNSLNSISTLISENTAEAERFVDQLSKVYRYMLQASSRRLVSLQTELDFLTVYAELLHVRYGDCLRIEQRTDDDYRQMGLSPLTIQTLIDNAIKHNRMAPTQPLIIQVSTEEGQLRVSNTLQRKRQRVETTTASLSSLLAKYQLLSEVEPVVEEGTHEFSVFIPLLAEPEID